MESERLPLSGLEFDSEARFIQIIQDRLKLEEDAARMVYACLPGHDVESKVARYWYAVDRAAVLVENEGVREYVLTPGLVMDRQEINRQLFAMVKSWLPNYIDKPEESLNEIANDVAEHFIRGAELALERRKTDSHIGGLAMG